MEDWGCPAFWGLTAHLENVNAASDLLQEVKPPKSRGREGESRKSLELKEKE